MSCNPEKHHRRSIRLKGYDYTAAGYYFVTICSYQRECVFGEVLNGQIILNPFGQIVNYQWENLPGHFKNVELDEFVIMPNHVHGILILTGFNLVGAKHSGQPIVIEHDDFAGNVGNVGAKHSGQPMVTEHDDVAGNASPLQRHPNRTPDRPNGTKSGSLSAVIQNFSSVTTRKINRIRKRPGAKLWQRHFYEHIIRKEKELLNIRQYIINNPAKWEPDKENPNNWEPEE